MIYDGHSGSVEVTDVGLIIRHSKFIGRGKPHSTLSYGDIGAVYFNTAGMFVNGYIQFRAPGEPELGIIGVGADPNSVIIRLGQNDRFEELKRFVQGIINQRFHAPQRNSSVADELAKLEVLRRQGVLTEEEFQQQKLKVLR